MLYDEPVGMHEDIEAWDVHGDYWGDLEALIGEEG